MILFNFQSEETVARRMEASFKLFKAGLINGRYLDSIEELPLAVVDYVNNS